MTYVMSCLNGCYSDFLRMLEKISFGKKDVMFLLGDISDTGEEPMELLCDLSCRENIWPVAGDRDAATAKMLSGFSRMLESGETPDGTFIAEMNSWAASGGRVRRNGFFGRGNGQAVAKNIRRKNANARRTTRRRFASRRCADNALGARFGVCRL